MEDQDQIYIALSDQSLVGEARRKTTALCENLKFTETDCGRAAIIVTELANNIIRHAKTGEMLIRPLSKEGTYGIEIIAIDRGPGMDNVAKCISDGYSTAGTTGTGLGAVFRLSNRQCDIYSIPGQGTIVVTQIWPAKSENLKSTSEKLSFGVVCVPFRGESISGDGWACKIASDQITVMVTDGLGHGQFAANASKEAIRVFNQNHTLSPQLIIQTLHPALRKTRGAALAVSRILPSTNEVHFAGIGNIAATLISIDGSTRSMASQAGIVGHEIRKIQEFTYSSKNVTCLVMCTDGIVTRWQLDKYPGLLQRHPSLMAAVIYRDFTRARDDATVFVLKATEPFGEGLNAK